MKQQRASHQKLRKAHSILALILNMRSGTFFHGQPTMDLIAIVTLLGIVQGFFMGTLLLFSKKPNGRANKFLGALFICYSLSIIYFALSRGVCVYPGVDAPSGNRNPNH